MMSSIWAWDNSAESAPRRAIAPNMIKPNPRIRNSFYPDECKLAPVSKHLLGDGASLHVAGAFIDPADFGVTIQLFDRIVLGKSAPAHYFDALLSRPLVHLYAQVLPHPPLLHE